MAALTTPTLPSGWTVSSSTTSSSTPSCTHGIPDKNGHVYDLSACNAYWMYYPSFAAAVLFSVLFGLISIAHIFQAFWFKKRYCWVLIMGALWEFGSFVTRALATRKQQSLALVIVAQILFLLAPLLVNAFAYMTLGRLIYFFHPRRRVFGVKASSITKYFVWADFFSFLVQGTGGSMLSPDNGPKAMRIGLKVYMGGVGMQELFIVLFTILGLRFQLDMQNAEAGGWGRSDRRGWRGQMWTMYAVLALITTRIIFRLVEFKRGTEPDSDNPIMKNEAYIYVLDALPMFFAILLLNIFHPGRVLVGPESEFPKLSRKQKKALKEEKKKEEKARKKAEKERRRSRSRRGERNVVEHTSGQAGRENVRGLGR